MSNSKKTQQHIRQNEQSVAKSQKHEANLQKNSTLYFQVGLIICLLAAFGLLEMRFETNNGNLTYNPPPLEPDYSIEIPVIRPTEPVIETPVEKQTTKKSDNFIEVPDITPFDPPIEKDSPINDTPPVDPVDIFVEAKPEPEVIIPVDFVEQVPIFPGCEKAEDNKARKKCMSEKISKIIRKRFDTDLGARLGLSGKQVIQTQFRIDKNGEIVNIKTRAVHPQLEEEASRVIKKIPQMEPGRQQNKAVGVQYTLPIVFMVE